MFRLSQTAAVALVLLTASPVWAQSRAELAEQYSALPAVQQMMTEMFSPESSASQFKATLPPGFEITDDQLFRVGAVMSDVLKGLQPRMVELQNAAIAEVFTEEEIRAMIDFHSTDIGAQILVKTQPMFAAVMGELTPEIVQAMGSKQAEISAILSEPKLEVQEPKAEDQ